MSTMQIVFSVLGVIAIVAIVGHGMWSLRRNERRARERREALELKRAQANQLDDGVGEVRVIARRNPAPSSAAAEQPLQQTRQRRSSETPDVPQQPDAAPASRRDDVLSEPFELPSMRVDDARSASTDSAAESTPVVAPAKATEKTATRSEPTQQSMELPVERAADEPLLTETPDEVIVLHVVGDIQGTVLLQQMTELGFKFGDFDIFHRHVDTAGNGPVLFSLANMFNPGSFDIEQLESFRTDGVALFLALPIKSNSTQAFTMMHNAAVKLAQAIERGQVLDEQRNPLTRQTLQHIHHRIREYERKRLIRS